MQEQSWHYVKNDKSQAGPVSAEELTSLHQDGVINGKTLVWKKGSKDWIPLGSVQELIVPAPAANQPALQPETSAAAAKPAAQTNILTQRFANEGAGGSAKKPSAGSGAAGAGKFVMITVVVAALAAGAYFAKPHLSSLVPGTEEKLPDGENMGISEKMSHAETFLAEYESQALSAAREIGTNLSDPKTVKKNTKILSSAVERFDKKINALKLPCPTTKNAHSIPGYVAWAKRYETRSNQANVKINAACQGR